MAIPTWGQKIAIAFAAIFLTTMSMSISTPVLADRTDTVGETINENFDPGRVRGEHATSIAPPTTNDPSILDFVQNHKDQHDDEDQHDDD